MTDQEQKKVFSQNLNRLLALHSKSQKEVADAISVSPQTFNTWCQAIALPRMGKVQRLADYFNIPKSALIDPPETVDSAPHTPALTPDQEQLLSDYGKLNAAGKEKVREYAADLTEQRKYTEDTASSEKKMA